jgi:hypothetical protein
MLGFAELNPTYEFRFLSKSGYVGFRGAQPNLRIKIFLILARILLKKPGFFCSFLSKFGYVGFRGAQPNLRIKIFLIGAPILLKKPGFSSKVLRKRVSSQVKYTIVFLCQAYPILGGLNPDYSRYSRPSRQKQL